MGNLLRFFLGGFCGVTFPETNILDPENVSFQKEISIPTIHVGFRECVCLASLCFDDHLKSGWRFDFKLSHNRVCLNKMFPDFF